jgi:hypothetical protein
MYNIHTFLNKYYRLIITSIAIFLGCVIIFDRIYWTSDLFLHARYANDYYVKNNR